MALNLSEDSKKKLKIALANYLDCHQQIKEIRETIKMEIKEASELLEKKPGVISKVFANLKRKYETGKDDLEDLFEVVNALD